MVDLNEEKGCYGQNKYNKDNEKAIVNNEVFFSIDEIITHSYTLNSN